MSKPKDSKSRKQAQRSRDAALGIQRVEVRLSIREREQLETLRCARAGSGSGEPYSADEYISTLLRRDWERWQQQQAALATQTCPNCECALPAGCGGAFKGQPECWHTQGDKTIAL